MERAAVVLILDGSKSHDLEVLKGIKASDVFEIRVAGDMEAGVLPGEPGSQSDDAW